MKDYDALGDLITRLYDKDTVMAQVEVMDSSGVVRTYQIATYKDRVADVLQEVHMELYSEAKGYGSSNE